MRYGFGMNTAAHSDTPIRSSLRHGATSAAVSESRLEKQLHDGVRRLGGDSVKIAPTTAGVPDRMVLWPGGRIDLVELKTEKGKLRRIQEIWHYRVAKLGTEVIVVRGDAGIRDYLASRQQAVSA